MAGDDLEDASIEENMEVLSVPEQGHLSTGDHELIKGQLDDASPEL